MTTTLGKKEINEKQKSLERRYWGVRPAYGVNGLTHRNRGIIGGISRRSGAKHERDGQAKARRQPKHLLQARWGDA